MIFKKNMYGWTVYHGDHVYMFDTLIDVVDFAVLVTKLKRAGIL